MLKSNWGSTYEDRPTPQGDRIDEPVSIPFDEATDMAHRPIGFGWLAGVFDWSIPANRVRDRIDELRAQQTNMERLRQMEGTFDAPPEDEPDPAAGDNGPWNWEYKAPLTDSDAGAGCYTEYDWEVAEQEDSIGT